MKTIYWPGCPFWCRNCTSESSRAAPGYRMWSFVWKFGLWVSSKDVLILPPFFLTFHISPQQIPCQKGRNTLRFLSKYVWEWCTSICVFPCWKAVNCNTNFLVINSVELWCMFFVFPKQFQLYLRKILKLFFFPLGGKEDWSCKINASCRRKVSFFN